MTPPAAIGQPHGTVTFLFSDIEGSTRLLQTLGSERYGVALEQHRLLLRRAFADHGGYEVNYEGDEFFVAFQHVSEAIAAAAAAQQALARHAWPAGTELRVRIGVHTGEPLLAPPKYVGLDVHKAARLMSAAHGGQVLISQATRDRCHGELPEGVTLHDLGEHRLKDLSGPERLHQLVVAGLRQDFPPPRTLSRDRIDLPAPPNRLVGRARELAEVCALLARVDVRLLTLTGPGGSGKTRLALQAAADRSPAYRDGVRFVTLASIADTHLIAPTIAQTLALSEQADVELAEVLRAYLAGRELLLVLDNLEQLVAGAALLGELLAACPALRLLVTSREPLHLAGEHEYRVPPLDEGEAIELFLERARAARRDFAANGEVAAICRCLDALPLAVELAAARVKALSAAQILARLDNRLPLLTGGPRDAPARQRTLRATIDWSHDLLSAGEQRLFARLSVFAGGCTLEAAEAVCETDLDTLQSLVDKSLVRHEADRYLMLETIDDYAHEQLERSTEADHLRRRHAEHFLQLAEQAAPEMRAAQNDRLWLDILEAERPNLRAALEWLIGRGDGERAHRLACALFSFWHDRGPVSEACQWFSRALSQPASRARCAATFSLGSLLAIYYSEHQLGRAWAAEGLALARETGDRISTVAALLALGVLAVADRRREEGVRRLEEALAVARDTGNEWAIGVTLVTLLSHDAVDDPARARALSNEAGRLENVSTSTRAMIAQCRGFVAEQSHDFDEALSLYRESVAVARQIGFDKACAALLNLGWLALRQGDPIEASARLTEGVVLAEASGARGMVAGGIAYLAVAAGTEGDPLRAAVLRGALETYRETVGEVPLSEFADDTFDQYLDRARALTRKEAWAQAFETGRRMSLEEAARYALESKEADSN